MSRPFIHLEGLRKTYHTRGEHLLALSNVTMKVYSGELISLVGPSGCGKTTILKILAGLQDYEDGVVQIGSGDDPFDPSRDVGMDQLVDTYFELEEPFDVNTAYTNEFLDKTIKMTKQGS